MATISVDAPGERFHEIELPPVPEYDNAELAAVDEALVTAIERAVAADEAVLAHLLRCEIGPLRYKNALGCESSQYFWQCPLSHCVRPAHRTSCYL